MATVILAGLSIVISVIALLVALWDRSPRLTLRARKGEWYVVKPTVDRKQVLFAGVVEAYNVSARPNAICDYVFCCKRTNDSPWEPMESENYQTSEGQMEEKNNQTPFSLAPYSGAEVRVMALAKMPQPYEMQVRVEVEDLFGKRYHADLVAKS